ncbi:PEP-CTERM sorting domain-containing protein [Roseateles sp. DC23W]|uniref:PEP-CTERM sorting domain-containing protein n=1 Tax=Pelomonas dachongensis TaxID=3299029 RepID=A0ABW7EVS7_9BURK
MIRKTLLAAALAGLALQAQAAPVVVDFSTTGFVGGSLAGQTLTGQFSYDDTGLDTSTAWLALSSFSFTLAGQTYAFSSLELGGATAAFFDGQLVGVDTSTASAWSYDFTFSSDFGSGFPYAFYTSSDSTVTDDFGFADVSFQPTATVPEPATYALVLAALGGGLFARRRKA